MVVMARRIRDARGRQALTPSTFYSCPFIPLSDIVSNW